MNERGLHQQPSCTFRHPSYVTDVTDTLASFAYTGKTCNLLMSNPIERVHVGTRAESTAGAAAALVLPSLAARQHVAAVPTLRPMTLVPVSARPLVDEGVLFSDRAVTVHETDPFHSDYMQDQLRPNEDSTGASMSPRDLFWSYLHLNTVSSLIKQEILRLMKVEQNERKTLLPPSSC
jgi:hypothetical protein